MPDYRSARFTDSLNRGRLTDPCIGIIHLGCNFQGPLIFQNTDDIRLKELAIDGTLVIDVNALSCAY